MTFLGGLETYQSEETIKASHDSEHLSVRKKSSNRKRHLNTNTIHHHLAKGWIVIYGVPSDDKYLPQLLSEISCMKSKLQTIVVSKQTLVHLKAPK